MALNYAKNYCRKTSTSIVLATQYDFSSTIKSKRPALNPDFNPDESCLFDVEQIQCIPGSEQECPEGFSATIPENCVTMIAKNGNWECPTSYHSVEGDETAQCYPNSEPCPRGATLVPHGEYDRCTEMVVGVIPILVVISKDIVDGECVQGYELT